MHMEASFPWLAGMSVALVEGNYRSQYQLSSQKVPTQALYRSARFQQRMLLSSR
jgi:hypothetical protein